MPRSAQAKGSANAARTAGSVGPSGTTFFATSRGGRAMNSPYAPLTNSRSSQRFERPARHGRHAPHGAEFAATTRSPSRTPRTPAPTAVTVRELVAEDRGDLRNHDRVATTERLDVRPAGERRVDPEHQLAGLRLGHRELLRAE